MQDNSSKPNAEDWLDQLARRIAAIDWSSLVRSRHSLHCKMLRNRATLLYPANLWHTDVRSFEWLQATAIANQLQLREADDGDGPAQDAMQNGVSTLGLHMLLYAEHDGYDATRPLKNSAPACDVAAVLKLAQLAREHGRHSSAVSNALLHSGTDAVSIHSCNVIGSDSTRLLQYYAGRQTQVVSYSVANEQVVDLFLGGGAAAAPLVSSLARLTDHRIELETFAEPGKPMLGLLRASYCRPLSVAASTQADRNDTPTSTLAPA